MVDDGAGRSACCCIAPQGAIGPHVFLNACRDIHVHIFTAWKKAWLATVEVEQPACGRSPAHLLLVRFVRRPHHVWRIGWRMQSPPLPQNGDLLATADTSNLAGLGICRSIQPVRKCSHAGLGCSRKLSRLQEIGHCSRRQPCLPWWRCGCACNVRTRAQCTWHSAGRCSTLRGGFVHRTNSSQKGGECMHGMGHTFQARRRCSLLGFSALHLQC